MPLRKLLATCACFFCGMLCASDAYPLWNGRESVQDYAARVKLDAEKSLDLGGGVKLELTLVPAGRFIMGSRQPEALGNSILSGNVLIGIGAAAGVLLLTFVVVRLFFKRRVPFLLGLLMAGIMAWSAGRWYVARLQAKEYALLQEQFELAADSEKPAHPVTISKPFYAGKYEVTQAQYEAVMGANPSKFKGANRPVENVSWKDAAAFCEKLKARNGVTAGLPTEAQWEYACRAGTVTPFNTGNTLEVNQANIENPETKPVGNYAPNAFGLHDMHGNVWEWCQDFYGETYYKESLELDPPGPAKSPVSADARVLRGGSLTGDPDFYRSASRRWLSADDHNADIGFRVVLR